MTGRVDALTDRLRIPLIAAPMLRVSRPELVSAVCGSGVIGAFPTINARSAEGLDAWLTAMERAHTGDAAPHCPNLVIRQPQLREHLDVLVDHRPELVITSVGSPAAVIEPLHAAGTLVLSDVATLAHARKAIDAGADGLVLVTAGAGGQTGWLNPLAFVRAVRAFFDGPFVVAGRYLRRLRTGRRGRARRRPRVHGDGILGRPGEPGPDGLPIDGGGQHHRRRRAHPSLHRPARQHAATLHRRRGTRPGRAGRSGDTAERGRPVRAGSRRSSALGDDLECRPFGERGAIRSSCGSHRRAGRARLRRCPRRDAGARSASEARSTPWAKRVIGQYGQGRPTGPRRPRHGLGR